MDGLLDLARAHGLKVIIWLLDDCKCRHNGTQPAASGCGGPSHFDPCRGPQGFVSLTNKRVSIS